MKILSEDFSKDSIVRRSQKIAYLKELAKLMKLHSMDHLEEGNCIRVWNWDFDSIYVADISYSPNGNVFSIIHFGSFRKDSVDYVAIHQKFNNLKPKISWGSLLLSIKEYQIAELPDGKMNNKSGLTQKTCVQFEIFVSGGYHFYEYYEPDYYRTVDSNANKVYSFLNHLNQQAGIRFYKGEPDFIYEEFN